MLPTRQRRRLLNSNHVIFQAQVSIDILLRLEMARNNPRPVRKTQHAAIRRKVMLQPAEQPPPQILKMLPLPIVGADPQSEAAKVSVTDWATGKPVPATSGF